MDVSITVSVLSSILVLLILIFVTFKIAVNIFGFLQKSKTLNKFDHDPPHWFWGNLKDFPQKPDDYGLAWKRERAHRFSDACLTWLGPFLPEIGLSSAQSVKPILKSAEPKGKIYRFLRPWLGDGLLLSHGEKWARNRRLLTPAFHFEILKPYLQIKNKAADKLCSQIQLFADSGQYFDGCPLVTMFTLDVILKCAFSHETHCQDVGQDNPYVKAIHEMGVILNERFIKPWLHPDWIFYRTSDGKKFLKHCDHLHKITEDIIAQRKAVLGKEYLVEGKVRKTTDFLDILLIARDENNVGLTDAEIREEVDTFLFEGHDTTASAIYWALYSLAQHGEIQDKVQREIDSLMMARDTNDIQASDLNRLPFLTMCIKESLRLNSTVSFIQRHPENDHQICGRILPKDTMTSIYIYTVHHNPQHWDDSTSYRPERFSPENIEKIDPFAFIPFSAGPRNCIGQNFALHEIKVALVKILHQFFLELDPNHEVKRLECLVMRADNGIQMKAIPRKHGEYRYQEH